MRKQKSTVTLLALALVLAFGAGPRYGGRGYRAAHYPDRLSH